MGSDSSPATGSARDDHGLGFVSGYRFCPLWLEGPADTPVRPRASRPLPPGLSCRARAIASTRFGQTRQRSVRLSYLCTPSSDMQRGPGYLDTDCEPAMETSAYILTELAALYPQSTLRSVCHCDRLRRGVPLKPTLLGEVLWPVPFCTALTQR